MYYNIINRFDQTDIGRCIQMKRHSLLAVFCTLLFSSLLPVAVVFSGGGGRGAYQVGVYGALLDLDIEIEGIFGTSVGAINAAGIISEGYEATKDLWYDMEYTQLMEASPELYNLLQGKLFSLNTLELASALRLLTTEGGIDVSLLKEKLRKIISEEKIRKSRMDFGVVAYSLSDVRPFVIYKENCPEGLLVDYVLASANFPAFKREEIGNELFIDGGVYSNIPLFMARERGFKEVVAVDVMGLRIGNSLAYVNLFNEGMEVILLEPSQQFGTVMTFDGEISVKYVICGYLDTMKAFGKLVGDRYFIFGDSDPLADRFLCLDLESRCEALALVGLKAVENAPAEYHYYRQLIPWLETVMDCEFTSPALTVMKLLEELAEFLEIDRLWPYTPRLILEKVESTWDPALYIHERSVQFLTKYNKLLRLVTYVSEKSPYSGVESADFAEFVEKFRLRLSLSN